MDAMLQFTSAAAASLTSLAPILALIWAIFAFYGARKADRDDELRRERQKIYLEYLSLLNETKSEKETLWQSGLELMATLGPLHEKISLISPDPVAKASLKFLNLQVGKHLWKDGKPLPVISKIPGGASNTQIYDHSNALMVNRDAKRALLLEMRKDLLQGTKVDPFLTDIEDLHKNSPE